MMRHSRSRTAFQIVACASALALTLTACGGRGGNTSSGSGGSASSPGITDTALTLGITTPLSGATAGPGTCTVAGVKAYFGAKNAAGGIKFGDGKSARVRLGRGGAFVVRHRYRLDKKHPTDRTFRVTVTAVDKAGNKTTKHVSVRVIP